MKLIFLHGSGSCKESWQLQTEYFADSEALDLPGHPTGAFCRTIDEYVQWLNTYVSRQGYRDLIIAGHSMGGAIGLLYGLTFPEKVKGLVCVGSGARLRVHPVYLKNLAKAIDASVQTQSAVIKSFYPLNRMDPGLAGTILHRVRQNGLPAILNDLRACDQFDVMDRLSDIKIPLLAICGTDDDLTPCKYAHYLVEHMQNARSVVISGGTHFVHAEKPVEVNRAIEAFVERL